MTWTQPGFFSSYLIHHLIQCEELIQLGMLLIFTQHSGFLTSQLLFEPTPLWSSIGLDVHPLDLARLTVYHICMWGLFIRKQHFAGIWKHMFLNIQTYLIIIFHNLKLNCGPHLKSSSHEFSTRQQTYCEYKVCAFLCFVLSVCSYIPTVQLHISVVILYFGLTVIQP